MWPFRRKPIERPRSALRRLVAGLIIGGAIGSIVGSKMIEKAKNTDDEDETDDDA